MFFKFYIRIKFLIFINGIKLLFLLINKLIKKLIKNPKNLKINIYNQNQKLKIYKSKIYNYKI